jgi:hypothetical protein
MHKPGHIRDFVEEHTILRSTKRETNVVVESPIAYIQRRIREIVGKGDAARPP